MSNNKIYTFKQDKANWITHFIGILFFIPAGFYLIIKGANFIEETNFVYPSLLLFSLTAMSVFVLMIYTSSTIYHSSNPFKRKNWRKFDHISIYWGIAGTYLPFITFNYSLTGKNIWLFYFMIGLAIVGTFLKVAFKKIPKLISISLYMAMGWAIVFFGKDFISNIPKETMILLVIGGLAYSIGVMFYTSKKLYYSHAIWHVFVLIGSISHYFSVLNLLN